MSPISIVELVRTIHGVKQQTAQTLIAECGADMSILPAVRHFASTVKRLSEFELVFRKAAASDEPTPSEQALRSN